MKTALATIVALGLLAGTADAQTYSFRHAAPSYGSGPAYCPPGVTFRQTSRVIVAPRVAVVAPKVAVGMPAEMPAEAAPAVAAAPEAEAPAGGDAPQAEAPADDAPQGGAANPPG